MKSLNKFFIVSASLALLLSACGSNEEASTQEKSQQVQQEDEASVSEEQSDSKDSQANKEPEETESNDVESKGEVTPDKEEPVVEEKTNENVKEKPSNEKSSTESPEDKEQTEVTKEEQEAKPAEEQKDAVSNEKPKEEQPVENPEVQDKELVQSDNQEYAIKVLEGYELAGEEPGRDTVMYKEDGSQFMRIELLSDISEKQAVEVVKQTAMAVDPNASQKASVPAEGKLANAEWYEAKSNDMNVQVIVTKGTKPVKITIFSKSAEQTDKFIEMANTIQ